MQTAYQLKNFKAFQDTGIIDLAPITILCGENSIGKSSILKSLLLLRQSTAERRSRLARNAPTQPFLFNGELTRLGSWRDTINATAEEKRIEMRWSASGTLGEVSELNRMYPWRRRNINEKFDIKLVVSLRSTDTEAEELSAVLAYATIFSGSLEFTLTEQASSSADRQGLYLCDINNLRELIGEQQFARQYTYGNPGLKDAFDILRVSSSQTTSGHLRVTLEGPFPTSVDPLLNSSWYPFLDSVAALVANSRVGFRGPRPGWVSALLESVKEFKAATQNGAEYRPERSGQDLAVSLIRVLCSSLDYALELPLAALSPMWRRLRYLGPLRHQPQRFYQFDDTGGIDIGVSGEFTVQVLALEANNQRLVSGIESGSDGLISLIAPRRKSLLDATNDWLEVMGLPKVHPNGLRQSLYELRVGAIDVALPDVGFGVSQVLPIVVEALRSNKGDTLILEQPEIHLHPKVQASLADFLISRASDGIKFIVESHSEYLVKRLCRRISEGTFPMVSSLINIIFVATGGDGEAVCERVELNQFGEIQNWPVGFFDSQEDLYWTEAALKRRIRSKDQSRL